LKFVDLSMAENQPRLCPDCGGPLKEYCICEREFMLDHLARHRRNCGEFQRFLRMDAKSKSHTLLALQRHKARLDHIISHFGLTSGSASDPLSPPSSWRWCPRGRELLIFSAEDTPPSRCSKHGIQLKCVCLCGSTVSHSSAARHRNNCMQWTAYQQADTTDKIRIREQLWSLLKIRESLYRGTPLFLLVVYVCLCIQISEGRFERLNSRGKTGRCLGGN
jgi:hypothetical protein